MVNAVLERLYREKEVLHRDGRRKPVIPPGLPVVRGEYLFRLVRDRRPEATLETGFAYGVSALFIAEALRQNGAGRHIVIDPFERTRFDGLGLAHLEEAGLADRVTFYEEPSQLCLARLAQEGVRVDLAFVDGHHLFDYVIADCLLAAQLLPEDGLLVVDDTNLPAIARACDFFATNRPDFRELNDPARPKLFRLFRRTAERDARNWDHFVPF
jgi:predicted O-methyltransferase YrrM